MGKMLECAWITATIVALVVVVVVPRSRPEPTREASPMWHVGDGAWVTSEEVGYTHVCLDDGGCCHEGEGVTCL
jgi:hypothetical protein